MALPLPIVSQSLERSAGVDRYAATTFILRVVLTTMIALLPLIAVSAAPAEARQPFDHARLASTALAAHILPGYRRLERAAVALSQTLDRACPATSRARRKSLQDSFDALVTAWGRIEHIQFGPITEASRLERILFWPDRRGLGARQLAKVLADRDPRVLDAGALSKRSIALQGIGTLDMVLFASGQAKWTTEEAAHRCGFAKSIATNLTAMSREVAEAWMPNGQFGRSWLSAGPGNRHFLRPDVTTLALAKAYDQGLERVRDERIAGPLGLNASRRRMPVILAASGRAMRLVTANIEGLRELFQKGGMAAAIVATDVRDATVSLPSNTRLIAGELKTANDAARALIGAKRPFDNAASANRLLAMGFPLKNARAQATALLTLTAGLTLGFNSSDGD